MGSTGKYLIISTVACAALLLAGLALRTRGPASSRKVAEQTPAQTSPEISSPAFVRQNGTSIAPAQTAPADLALVVETLPPLSPKAASVPDKYLVNLSAMVDLPHAISRPPDKARWAQSIHVAEQLLQGACDCEQRNWLSHFVEVGNLALTGSVEEYHKALAILVTLARNDSQPIASNAR